MRRRCPRCQRLPIFPTHLAVLDKYRQRVTYGAFAKFLNTDPRSPLRQHVKDHFHAWVVDADGLPSGYAPSEIPPDIGTRPHIIDNAVALAAWLASPA